MAIVSVTGQILFLSALGILGLLLQRISKLDTTLACVAAGVIGGLSLPFLGVDTGIRASNIHDLVFYIMLPVLIFHAAWHIQPGLLKRWLLPISLLASVGVLISTGIIAAASYFGIGHASGFPWIAALLTGAILSATDPVAVVTALRDNEAPEDLATLIEGESLFNDATAVVLFSVILSVATGGSFSAGADGESPAYLSLFFTVFFGGLIVGALLGLLAAILALALNHRSHANIVLVFLAFGSFYVAERFFHVSGIMAVMAAAIISKSLLAEHQQRVLKDVEPNWNWLGQYFTALLFVIMGLVLSFDMLRDQWLAIIIAVVACLLARIIPVTLIGALQARATHSIPWSWQKIQIIGGLRGAIAIALVLSLPSELHYWWTVQAMVFGVVLFSLLLQSPLSAWMIAKLKH